MVGFYFSVLGSSDLHWYSHLSHATRALGFTLRGPSTGFYYRTWHAPGSDTPSSRPSSRSLRQELEFRYVVWDSHILSWGPLVISVQFTRLVAFDSLRTHGLQHIRPPCLSPTPRAYSNSCPLSWWCHPTISSSVVPFSSCLQSFPASGSFLMSQLFASGGQSIRASASASVVSMNIQDWFSLGLTGSISLQPKRLSRVFSNSTVQKHQFFGAQPSLWSNSHIHISI